MRILFFMFFLMTNVLASEPIQLELKVKEEKTFEDKKIQIESINDSRCPKDARCVWAGNVIIKLKWGEETYSLTHYFQEKPAKMGKYNVVVKSVNEEATKIELVFTTDQK